MAAFDEKSFDACVYTNADGRERLRNAGLQLANAIQGHVTSDLKLRYAALEISKALAPGAGALAICANIELLWNKIAPIRDTGEWLFLSPEIKKQLELFESVAMNVYHPPAAGFPWKWLLALGVVGAGGVVAFKYRARLGLGTGRG